MLRGRRENPVYLSPLYGSAAPRKLDRNGKPIESDLGERMQHQAQFTPLEPRLFLQDRFAKLADAPNIVLCTDGRTVPVAMDAD